jgi:heme exporter protein D
MDSLSTYLAMGGYASFVWSAYGIAAIVLGGITVASWRRYRASQNALERLQQRAGPRR